MLQLKNIRWLILFAICVFGANNTYADHITGGEMYYQYVGMQNGNYMYRITCRLLMRCNSGRSFPNPIQISVFANETNARLTDIAVPLGDQTTISLGNTNPCISNPPEVCYEVARYYTDISLSPSAQGYTVAAQVNFRVNGLANLIFGASGIGATYIAEIPGAAAVDSGFVNNSAHFTGSDLVVVCANSPFNYSFSAVDPDGDELQYTFCAAYQTGTSGGGMNNAPPLAPPYPTVPYREGYDGNAPLGSKVIVNAKTGLVTGIAPETGYYVITVCVAEIRNGKVIATQRKDIQLNITGCTLAAALLSPAYQLCNESNEIRVENLSLSPLIQTYSWKLVNQQGSTVAISTNPTFTHKFSDTGLYRIHLNTNPGLPCPDSTAADVRYYPGFKVGFNYTGLCFRSVTRFQDITTTRYGAIGNRNWVLGEPANSQNLSQIAQPIITYLLEGTKAAFLRVENINGCVDSVSRSLTISKDPPLQIPFRDTLICLPDTLQLQVLGDGTFTWDAAPGIINGINTPTPRVAPLVTTWFRVTQQVDNCIGRDSIQVRVVNKVSLTAGYDSTICAGDTIQLRLTGNAIFHQWSPDVSLSTTNSVQPKVWPGTLTNYKVRATISNCVAEENFKITPVPYPQAEAGPDVAICYGNSVQLNAQHNGLRVEWSPPATLSNYLLSNPVASPLQTTRYTLLVYDNKGCPKTGIDFITVSVEPVIDLQVTTDTSVVVGQLLQLNATGAALYQWNPTTWISNPNSGNATFRFTTPYDELRYTLVGFNSAGCRDSAEISIRVFANGTSIFVPNAFTPNVDGLNETLKPTLAGMERLEYFRVFNRYGELVFTTTNPYQGWNGIWKGQKQASGHYVWMVQAIDYKGNVIKQKGSSMLLR